MFLSSDRLVLRKFTHNDFDLLYELDSNPEVMEFITNGIPMTREHVKVALSNILRRYSMWKGKYGVWAAHIQSTNEFIGWFALKPFPKLEEIEVGYRLLPKFWNRGFATEGTKRLLSYGFNDLELEKITAIAMLENKASRRVLIKAGLAQIGMIKNPFGTADVERVVYFELSKADYLKEINNAE